MDLAEILRTASDKKIEFVRFEQSDTPGCPDKADQWERDELFEFR